MKTMLKFCKSFRRPSPLYRSQRQILNSYRWHSTSPKIIAIKSATKASEKNSQPPTERDGYNSITEIDSGLSVKTVFDTGILIKSIDDKLIELVGPAVLYANEFFLWDVPMYGRKVDFILEKDADGVDQAFAELRGVVNDADLFGGWTGACFSLFRLLESPPELVIFGTGGKLVPLPVALKQALTNQGISVDVMSSRIAADTFNLLSQDGRKVALCILPTLATSSLTGMKHELF